METLVYHLRREELNAAFLDGVRSDIDAERITVVISAIMLHLKKRFMLLFKTLFPLCLKAMNLSGIPNNSCAASNQASSRISGCAHENALVQATLFR